MGCVSSCLPLFAFFPAAFEKKCTDKNLGWLAQVAARRLVDRSLFKTRTAVALYEELIRQRQRDFESFKEGLTAIEGKRREIEERKKQAGV